MREFTATELQAYLQSAAEPPLLLDVREPWEFDKARIEGAVLMPMVALLGGNSGAQSLAVIIRAMAVGQLPRSRALRAVRREFAIGAINGVVIAVLAGLAARMVAALTDAPAEIGFIVALAVFVAMVAAGLAGAGIPVILRRLGLDPALASKIFLTTVTDLVGFGGFLLTATALL